MSKLIGRIGIVTFGIIIGSLFQSLCVNKENNVLFIAKVDQAIKEGVRRNEAGITLTNNDKYCLLKASRRVLESYFSENTNLLTTSDFSNVPLNVLRQKARVFVTLITNGCIRGCQSSQASNLLQSVIKAAYKAIEDERFGGSLVKKEIKDVRVEITLLLNPIEVKSHKIKLIKENIEVGIDSFSLKRDSKRAFFKSSVPVSHNYSLEKALKKLGKKAKIGSQAYQDPEVKIYKYPTIQFAEHFDNKSLVNMFRYNRLFYQSKVIKEAYIRALRECGNYMANHIDNVGLITYEYDVYKDRRNNPSSPAAVIRSLASIWVLALITEYFDDDKYRQSVRSSVEYYLNRYYVYDEKEDFGYIKTGESANIGTAAFMLLCLVAINDKNFHAEEKQKLINFIQTMEDKEKGFLYPVYLPDKYSQFERKEVYYSGEALAAVMVLYERTKNKEYLAIAERVFDYYRDLFQRASKRMSMAPWMSKVYSKVFFATGDKKYAEFVLEMNDEVVKYQNSLNSKYVDKIGSFFSKGSAYSTGVYVESLAEGYRVAKALGDKERSKIYKEAIFMGNRFIIQSQYRENNMFTAKNRILTLGGIRTSVYKSSIRIDTVQHGGNALLKTLEYVY